MRKLYEKLLLEMVFEEWVESPGRSGEAGCRTSQCAKQEKSKAGSKNCELCRAVVKEDSRKRCYGVNKYVR